MCDIGFCLAKIIRGNELDMAMPCLEACSFNLKQVENKVVKKVKEEMKMEFTIRGKRKQ